MPFAVPAAPKGFALLRSSARGSAVSVNRSVAISTQSDRVGEFFDRLKTLARVETQALLDRSSERRWRCRRYALERPESSPLLLEIEVRSRKREVAAQHLIERHAKRENVRSDVPLAELLLGRHIRKGSRRVAVRNGQSRHRVLDLSSDAEIHHL